MLTHDETNDEYTAKIEYTFKNQTTNSTAAGKWDSITETMTWVSKVDGEIQTVTHTFAERVFKWQSITTVANGADGPRGSLRLDLLTR